MHRWCVMVTGFVSRSPTQPSFAFNHRLALLTGGGNGAPRLSMQIFPSVRNLTPSPPLLPSPPPTAICHGARGRERERENESERRRREARCSAYPPHFPPLCRFVRHCTLFQYSPHTATRSSLALWTGRSGSPFPVATLISPC